MRKSVSYSFRIVLWLTLLFLAGCIPPGIGDGDAPAPTTIVVTLYVHEETTSGPPVSGAKVQGHDGANNSFDGFTDSNGLIQISGTQGVWYFSVSKGGYQTKTWNQNLDQSCRLDISLQRIDPCGGQTGYIYRECSWWGDYLHKWNLQYGISRYLYCRSEHADVPRFGYFPWYGFAKLVTWPEDDSFVLEFAQTINSPYSNYYEIATNTLHFVQALMPYTPDIGDYWQTPVETLVLKHGDCEDGTILLIALLHALRFPVCFGVYANPTTNRGHAFGLVQVSQEWVDAHEGLFNKCWLIGQWTILRRTTDNTLWAMAETTLDPSLGPLDYGGLGCGTIPDAAWEAGLVKMFDVETGANISSQFEQYIPNR